MSGRKAGRSRKTKQKPVKPLTEEPQILVENEAVQSETTEVTQTPSQEEQVTPPPQKPKKKREHKYVPPKAMLCGFNIPTSRVRSIILDNCLNGDITAHTRVLVDSVTQEDELDAKNFSFASPGNSRFPERA
jgi:hypothetical protein